MAIKSNFEDTKETVMFNLKAGNLVNVVGDGGIGKTSMMKEIAEELNMNFITIAANNLKEGELSMPIVSPETNEVKYVPLDKLKDAERYYEAYKEYRKNNGKQYSFKELFNKDFNKLKELYMEITEAEELPEYEEEPHSNYVDKVFYKSKLENENYSKRELEEMPFEKLEEIYKKLNNDSKVTLRNEISKSFLARKIREAIPKPQTMIFVDEIARADQAVQSEVMNVLLEKQINGYKLPENVSIVLAQNPSSDMPGFAESDYASTPMDNAVSSRLTFIHMVPDMESFINYGTQYVNGKTIIHESVMEFLTENDDSSRLFRNIKETNVDFNDTNPRSWEKLSNLLYTLEEDPKLKALKPEERKRKINRILEITAQGKITVAIAQQFVKFYIDQQIKLPKSSEVLFEYNSKGEKVPREKLLKQHIEIIDSQKTLRQLTFKTALINYLRNNPELASEKVVNLATEALLTLGNTETNATAIRTIVRLADSDVESDKELNAKFVANDLYTDEAYKLFERLSESLL